MKCDIKNSFYVSKIEYGETKDFILNKHYAGRMPSISYSYGLFEKENNTMVGVLTIGKPASHSLCVGVCGKEYSDIVGYLMNITNYPINVLF